MNEKTDSQRQPGRDVRDHAREPDVTELDDPMDGSPDMEPGDDSPDQRPITDNKAGG
jgi:hypothetical protein